MRNKLIVAIFVCIFFIIVNVGAEDLVGIETDPTEMKETPPVLTQEPIKTLSVEELAVIAENQKIAIAAQKEELLNEVSKDTIPLPKSSDVNTIIMTLVKNELQWSKKQIKFSVIKSLTDNTDFAKVAFSDPDNGMKYVQSTAAKTTQISYADKLHNDVEMETTDITLTDEQFSRPEFVKKQWAVMYQTDDGISTIIRGNRE